MNQRRAWRLNLWFPLLLAACVSVEQAPEPGSTPPPPPAPETFPAENPWADLALATLPDLQETDVLIRLDNGLLRQQIMSELQERAGFIGAPSIRDIDIRFGRQFIGLAARLDLTGPQGESLTVDLSGDVRLAFSGNHLIWLPQFLEARVLRNQPGADGASAPRLTLGELAAHVERINREITDAVIILGKHRIQLNPVPMGRIEVGVAVDGLPQASVEGAHELGGVFAVAGSAIMIEPAVTSVVLDLEFVPAFTACTADLVVSRSGFAQDILEREPVGVLRYLEPGADIRHFFTEIKGATRPTAVLHYWFADGQPAGLEELAVEPSERWRTWSSKSLNRTDVRNWEVVVVERDTGCILHSQAIRSEPGLEDIESGAGVPDAYSAFVAAFGQKLSGFSILQQQPEVAQIEIGRSFMGGVLTKALQDISIELAVDLQAQERKYQAELQPFPVNQMVCESRQCDAGRTCQVTVSRCVRQHDTRDCTTCLFRNPLNNRCVNEVEDPICVAARDAQNRAFEANREACLEDERMAQIDCERRRSQEIRSCEIEAATATDTCTSMLTALQQAQEEERMATVLAEASSSGQLSARFSGFRLSSDLSTLDMNLDLRTQAALLGELRVQPTLASGPVSRCLAAWQSAYRSQLIMPSSQLRLLGAVTEAEGALIADWSGLVLSARLNPAPLEAVFIAQPELLSRCQLGLRVEDVTASLEGEAPGFFRGSVEVEVRPLPSRIVLKPAFVQFGNEVYQARPAISPDHLTFDITRNPDTE